MKRYIIAILALACAVSTTPSRLSAACVNPPQGLVSWWPAEGNGNDVTGSNPATVGNGVGFSRGEVGLAFNFAGTGVVSVAASPSLNFGLTNGLTIECWIGPKDLSIRGPLVEWRNGSSNGVLFSVSDSLCGDNAVGSLFANIMDRGGVPHPIYSGVGLLTTSNFQHVAVTYDRGSGIGVLYLNGSVVAQANLGSFTPQTSGPLFFGRGSLAGVPAAYIGLLDELSIYGRALSLPEIRSIYNAGTSGKCQPTAPFIVTQPSSVTTVVGGNASFSVVAGGTPPLSYQWRFGGTNLSGATGTVLNLANVQFSDAGNYSVVVANGAGSVISSNALLTVSTGGCATVSSGLVSWWPAEGNGNDTFGSNPGTVTGVSYSAGEVAQAFNFNGTNGSVFIPASGSLNVGLSNGLTIECWIKPSDLSVRHPLVEWNNGGTFGVHFYVSQDWGGGGGLGDLFANITDTGGGWHPVFTAPGVLTTNSWQHVAVTYDKTSGLGKLYLNGAQVASANLGSFTPQTSYDLYFGRRASPEVVLPYAGGMDEVSVYSRGLSAGEIQSIYNAGSFGKCQGGGGGVAPFIITQPANQTVTVGGTATFSVTAGGTQPLSYQWRFGATNISGATNSSLTLGNVQQSSAGFYSVAVSNAFGNALSTNALLTVNTGGCATVSSGLVSWWPAEGNGNDIAGSNPGTVTGVSYSAGEVAQAFNFNGTNGSVFIPASGSLNVGLSNGLTIECWIKPSDLSVRHPLVEWNNGGTFGVHFYVSQDWGGGGGPGDLFANITDTFGGWHPVFTAPGVLGTNTWQHVAVTYDKTSGLGRLYLNGAQVASANLGSFTPQTSYDLYFGRRASPEVVAPYAGGMDEVSLYNRALTAGEIQSIYDAGSFGKCQGGGGGVAPFIITQPANQTVTVGGTATFNVTAGGTQPLSYQWRFGATNISGATSSSLILSNVQQSSAGFYSVAVSNAFGNVLSTNALLTVNTGGCATASSGLVSWWPAEGNGNDIAGSNPGTVSGIFYSAGEVGQAFNFIPGTGSVFIAASPSLDVGLSNGLTIECWIKPSDLSVRHPLVEWNNGGTFGVHFYVSQDWGGGGGPGDLFANITDIGGGWHPVFTAPGVLGTNSWQHVAVTYDKSSGLGKLYLNGSQVASENLGSFIPQTSYDLYFGRRASPEVVAPYAGGMDEVSLYNRALTAGEIQSIYDAGSFGKCQGGGGGVAPFIITQPANQTATVGGTATFSVTAGGTQPLSYQWRRGTNALNGATSSSLILSNVQQSAAGNYSVVVSNAFGSVTSTNAVLTVNPSGPFIITQPASQTNTVGATAFFNVAAGGAQPLSYQWRFAGTNLLGRTASSLVLTNVQQSDAGPYSVVVSNAFGSVTSSNAFLTVNPAGPFIITQPASQTVTVGATVLFSVTAGGSAPLTYQWRFGATNISGATASSLILSNVQVSAAGIYSVIVSNPAGTVLSSNALLTVNTGICATAASGLVSWWPAEGNGNDIAGSNPATVSGIFYSPGEVGQAFNFASSTSSVFVAASHSLDVGISNGLTIELWIKPNDLSVAHPLLEWNDGGTFGVHFYVSQDWNGGGGPGDLFANLTDTFGGWHPVFTGPGVLNTTDWQHVAVTYDKTTGLGKLYLNGAEVASEDLGIFTPQTGSDLYFGQRPSGGVAPYFGRMDEVSLYNRALTPEEIQGIYDAGTSGKCQPPGLASPQAAVGRMMAPQAIPGGFQVSFKGIPGREYEIQRAPNPYGPWTTLTTVVVGSDGIGFQADTAAPPIKAFYRNVLK